MTTPFPETMDFIGFNAPSRAECDIFDLEVDGSVPEDINGTWYRSIPDPQFSPMLGHDAFISGDGMVGMYRFGNGHVDYRMRYVMTERLQNDRAARRSLYGLYRNPFTDDPSVKDRKRGVANTTPIFHGGKLLALKEDSRAVELDPHTLATIGEWSYDNQLRSETMTAHPKLDPQTGELHFFGYEAGGLATKDVAYCVADKAGKLIKEEWFKVPYVSMMHDFAVTREHVIFPVFPTTCDLDRLKAGGSHWIFEPDKDSFIGIMPRDGSVKDMRWFKGPARMAYHIMNAFSEGSRVHMDACLAEVNVFPFILEASGIKPTPEQMMGYLGRWSFDLSKPGEDFEEQILGPGGDLPRVRDEKQMADYDIGYYLTFDPAVGPPCISGPVGPGFNTLFRLEVNTGKLKSLNLGPNTTLQEPVIIPSKKPGHEGYLAFVVERHDTMLCEVAIVEAEHLDKGVIATVKMPLRVRSGVHGNWVPAEAF